MDDLSQLTTENNYTLGVGNKKTADFLRRLADEIDAGRFTISCVERGVVDESDNWQKNRLRVDYLTIKSA